MVRALFALWFTALPIANLVGGSCTEGASCDDLAIRELFQSEEFAKETIRGDDGLILLQASFLSSSGHLGPGGGVLSKTAGPAVPAGLWPAGSWKESFVQVTLGGPSMTSGGLASWLQGRKLFVGCCVVSVTLLLAVAKLLAPQSNVVRAVTLAFFYIVVSVAMIETNKFLMQPGNFPYPLMMTTSHMLTSMILANCLRYFCPSAFPALQKIEVTRWFCIKFLPIGAAFAASIVCGNAAYKYCSVSLLQIMKQSNMVIIYTFSVICGLEILRRCSVILLAGVLCGAVMAIQGELHFSLAGVSLQIISSLCEAAKVIVQGLLMSGATRLDPLTMVLFMAPACLFANMLPLAFMELPRLPEIASAALAIWPLLLCNAMLAFALNVLVAQCIKHLSPVGYLLCGVVKDVCIVSSSAWLLGESLAPVQQMGFCIALCGVFLYSIYKQNQECFAEDNLLQGFHKLLNKAQGLKGPGELPEKSPGSPTIEEEKSSPGDGKTPMSKVQNDLVENSGVRPVVGG